MKTLKKLELSDAEVLSNSEMKNILGGTTTKKTTTTVGHSVTSNELQTSVAAGITVGGYAGTVTANPAVGVAVGAAVTTALVVLSYFSDEDEKAGIP